MKSLLIILLPLSVFVTSTKGQNMKQKSFIGTWTLLKFTLKQADGKISYPYGENPIGQLLYDGNGNMMVEIMKPDIKKFESPNPLQGTPEEISSAYNGFIAYYGTYTIQPASNLIIHHIKACSFPNWVDQYQRRFYEFEGNKLILRTDLIGSTEGELIWQRIQ